VSKIKKDLKKKGQSLIVTGDDSLVRTHIHSFEPGEILNYAIKLGKLHQIAINNMDDQYKEFIKMQKERMPAVDIAIVTVAVGDGFFEVLNSLGSAIIVPGGQTMNPSVRELLQAVELAPSDNVIILPNNKNIIPTASQIQFLTSKKVKVIPTRTIPQGIAALLALNYDMDLEENARIMEEAINKVKTVEVTKAVRKTQLKGLKIKMRQSIAILNDEDLIASADKTLDAIFEALRRAGTEGVELATIYYGAGIESSEAGEIAQEIRSKYQTEVEVVNGGQPYYDYIISLE
jgi:dihydroxyacetone kinase-like predicted kinase